MLYGVFLQIWIEEVRCTIAPGSLYREWKSDSVDGILVLAKMYPIPWSRS